MRTYGRVNGAWVVVETDAQGNDDLVYASTLLQCLQMTPGESPFFADHGIPAQQSVVTQVYPDYYVALMQSKFAKHFTSLSISRANAQSQGAQANPSYTINLVTHRGALLNQTVAT
jgi:hypothetical protein